jgi:hypothetical protein
VVESKVINKDKKPIKKSHTINNSKVIVLKGGKQHKEEEKRNSEVEHNVIPDEAKDKHVELTENIKRILIINKPMLKFSTNGIHALYLLSKSK